jgi:hypothetical protein
MAAEWERLCRGKNWRVEGPRIYLELSDHRRHSVSVEDTPEAYLISGIACRRAEVLQLPHLPILSWKRNRALQLVGFRIDQRQRLVGEAWVPKAGLTQQEFVFYVRMVAVECDRFEFMLTGRDME